MSVQADTDTYTMGRTAGEEQRLQFQADMLSGPTHRLLVYAGIEPGMKVLDLGSGAGDVALLAAELVGPSGSVVGIDVNDTILETARRRAAEAGYPNVTFIAGDLRTVELDDEFDAIVGRLILCHLADPTATLRDVLSYLRPGGIIAIGEWDFPSFVSQNSYPLRPLIQRASAWAVEALNRGGVDVYTARKLHQIFIDAGLDAPSMHGEIVLGGSEAFLQGYLMSFLAECVRSLLPIILREGIATEDEVDIDTLARRMFDEAIAANAVILSAHYVGAWTRKPA